MKKSITTSIRLDSNLSAKLEKAARELRRGKNWIISESIRKYLDQIKNTSLVQEARTQSLLINKQNESEHDLWEINSDVEEWNH